LDGVVEGVGEGVIDLTVVLFGRTTGEVEIPEQDPRSIDDRRKFTQGLV
jgi:hypothetical protein